MKNYQSAMAIRLSATVTLAFIAAGCGSGSPTYSLLSTGQTFTQSNNGFNNQLDILWVVDNSGSMGPLQTNMTTNFNSFIQNFQTLGYDFRMAVTSTDAYKANTSFVGYKSSYASLSLFQDGGNNGQGQTGVFVIIPSTPNLDTVFVDNATTGVNGSGDERAFSSLMTAMNNTKNPAFLRSTSFFAIIVLSDEDDFSLYSRAENSWGSNTALDHCYVDTAMDTIATTAYSGPNHVSTCVGQTPPDTVASYESALDTLTQSTGATRRWNENAITVLDSTCQVSHSGDPASYMTTVGQRYMQMAADTQGVTGSICDTSYAATLASIATQITTLSTQFFLSKIPVVSTIVVTVNGILIAESPTDGWQYNSAANSIQFFGAAVPPQGAVINIQFTPQGVDH
jgi:hypothetical protein